MIGDNGRLQYLRFCLFEMSVSVFLLCLYSAVSLTLVRKQRFIRIIYLFILLLHVCLTKLFKPVYMTVQVCLTQLFKPVKGTNLTVLLKSDKDHHLKQFQYCTHNIICLTNT